MYDAAATSRRAPERQLSSRRPRTRIPRTPLEAVDRALAEDEPLERPDQLDDLEARVAGFEAVDDALGLTDVCTFQPLRDELDET